jgi:hypothetical protein
MAKETDDRAAECAYSRPGRLRDPGSRGSRAGPPPPHRHRHERRGHDAPTVVAREPEKYAAAVMIAGGCDFFAITNETNYTSWSMRSAFGGSRTPRAEQLASIDARYLALAPLDSYHTAARSLASPS